MTKTEWRYGNNADCGLYHYTACGLDDVYLRSGYSFVETEYGRGVQIQDMDGLHDAIARHIARHKRTLTGKDFRFLRKQIGITQSELATLMDTSEQTIARWEKGLTEAPGPAESLIRGFYLCHAEGDLDLVELVKTLNSMSAEADSRQEFEQTAEGWKAAA